MLGQDRKNKTHIWRMQKFYAKNVDFFENKRIIQFCMDTNDFSRIPKCGSCPDLTRFRVVVGAKQLKKALQKGTARYVYLAENADPAITELLTELCRQSKTQFSWVDTMADLGRACGIEVGAAAAAVIE